jgi:F0F1-type ATP synthase membrane subunit c/vacuolar-type H+-ATPase subunit K
MDPKAIAYFAAGIGAGLTMIGAAAGLIEGATFFALIVTIVLAFK